MTVNHLVEPLLEKFTLDFNSEVSFEDQKKAGMKSLRKACLNFLEQAKIDRQARLEHAKELHLKEQVQRVKDREEYFARIDQETARADEVRLRDEEKEVSYKMRPHVLLSLQLLTRSNVAHQKRRRRNEEKSAAVRKHKVAKLHNDRHAGTVAAEIERHHEVKVDKRRHQKAVEMVRFSNE